MIAVAMEYSLIVAALLSGAAYALERTAALYRFPRRGIWAIALLASWVLPAGMMLQADRAPIEPLVPIHQAASQAIPETLAGMQRFASTISPSRWPALPALDEILAIGWGSMSFGLLVMWAVMAVRLYRRATIWPIVRIDGAAVSISDRLGPAVLGYLRPRIVMPNAVLSQSNATQSIALKHEQSHIAADDPALLLFGLVLVVLAPWNIALWWQLRRLRFAIEVDCDARVLSSGVGTVAYGETLLSISQQGVLVPLGMVALTEPTSQLERRVQIMMTGPVRYRKVLTGVSLAIAISLVLVATGLSAPAGDPSIALRKPPPSQDPAGHQKFVALLKDRYPALVTEKPVGTTSVVTVLFDHKGRVTRTEMEMFRGSPEEFKPSNAQFGRVGVAPDAVGYIGEHVIDFGTNRILVVYTEKGAQHVPFTSNIFADSRMIDRAIAERFFPRAFEQGLSRGEGIWVLFDREGAVLRTGQELFDPSQLIHILESRYPGIKASESTVTPVVDADWRHIRNVSGDELHLHSVWLAAGSPLPGA